MKKIEFEQIMKNRPHLVILGAGASIAAIPNGDKNGKKTSVMNGFIDKLGMSDIIENIDLETKSDNLEDIYSEIHDKEEYKSVREELDNRIFKYFSEFEIPDTSTVYDHLVLSLRKKDAIATFNWDPLLVQAYLRMKTLTEDVPELIFLHGNVAVGTCRAHKRSGNIDANCPICNKPFERIPLLYPVKEKNYDSDPFIKDNWNLVRQYMEIAYMVTVFGYSAPKTDESAINLLSKAWGAPDERNLEEIEIIDIRNEDDIKDSWKEFIHTHHYKVVNDFFESTIGKFPRRSTEALFERTMNNRFLNGKKGVKPEMTFDQMAKYFIPILKDEINGKYVLKQ